jgi:hypothetical protein
MAHFIMSSAPRPRRSANPFQAFLGVSYAARGTDNLILPLHDKASPSPAHRLYFGDHELSFRGIETSSHDLLRADLRAWLGYISMKSLGEH